MTNITWMWRVKPNVKKENERKHTSKRDGKEKSEENGTRSTPNDWEEKERVEGKDGEIKQRAWSVWPCPSFVFGLRGGRLAEADRLAALAQSQATHCATLPRKSPGLRRTEGLGGNQSPRPPKKLQQAPGGPLCPQLNHLTHLVP